MAKTTGIVKRLVALLLLLPGLLPSSAAEMVAFDIETTGFSPKRDRIIEIAAVRFDGTNVLARKSWLVNPGRDIPKTASSVHGIRNEDVRNAPGIPEVLPEFLEFIKGAGVMAHNARFDWGFIRAEAERHEIALPASKPVDTLPLARRWWPEADNHKLQTLADLLQLNVEVRHRALADADLLRQVWLNGKQSDMR